ncbi:hypothetical protein FPRO06_01676 [Fusarium proliferatum]|nr:hypothetical protein FPRO06_01676 [Fusarium proliferatum]
MNGSTENNETALLSFHTSFWIGGLRRGRQRRSSNLPMVSRGRSGRSMSPDTLEKDQAHRHEKFLAKQETKVKKHWKRVGLYKVRPDSITEEMLGEDGNIPMNEEEDSGEDTDHHLSTDDPTIHIHGGEAIMKADFDEEDALNVADDDEANLE